MESVTYVCYSKDDLAAQAKTLLTALQNVQAALLKVAENDTNAGTLEEIKALLGMNTEASSQAASTPSNTEASSTDTKSEENTVTEPSTTSEDVKPEPHTVTVQPGDTLQTIAEKTGATPRHLIDINMLMEPVVLRPGQTLNY